ncbi:XTP/dITP diphosphatase [Oceanobacillus manasiensis]|uniref:XTP/dITP diphosphatase n=1 Tax=Oceanobacillus manasiensis TaxID=586413 RepID=UPI0005A9CCF7|nr:XTP/dITP diphosphatase [Oceanobacillus manasiensis]
MEQVLIATRNAGKAAEFKQFFSRYQITALSMLDLEEELPDVEETGVTFEENAALKAEEISSKLGIPVLADDSGLMIDALYGEPGVFSARYAGTDKNDRANILKVLQKLQGVPESERTARFVCVIALSKPGEKTVFRTGYCEGNIAEEQSGENGFGYDPIFIPSDQKKTMAELTAEEKNRISHRTKAIEQFDEWIKGYKEGQA